MCTISFFSINSSTQCVKTLQNSSYEKKEQELYNILIQAQVWPILACLSISTFLLRNKSLSIILLFRNVKRMIINIVFKIYFCKKTIIANATTLMINKNKRNLTKYFITTKFSANIIRQCSKYKPF